MVRLLPLLLSVLHLAVVQSADPPTGTTAITDNEDYSILSLDANTLEMAIEEVGLIMIDFYAPWCRHCIALEPEYTKAATELEREGLLLAKVDCDSNGVLCDEDRWDIEALPTIKVVRGAIVHDYTGPRTAEGITKFMREVAAIDVVYGGDGEDDDDDNGEEKDGDEYFMEEDGILVLGAHDIDIAADQFSLVMVMFYETGVEGYAALESEYIEASDELYHFQIPLAKVNCFAQKELCEQDRWRDAADYGKMPELPFLVSLTREGDISRYGHRPLKRYNIVMFMKDRAGIDDRSFDDDGDDDEDDFAAEGGDGNEEVNESNIIVLDSSNIEATLKENEVVLVEFYAPWCGMCKRLKPKYAKAADDLAGKGVTLAKVDCTRNERLCYSDPWNIDRYPSIFLSRRGKKFEFEEAHERKQIVKYMLDVSQPSVKVLKDAGELEEFIDENEVSVVGFFEEGGCIAHKKFQEVADGDIKRPYGVVLDPHLDRSSNPKDQASVEVTRRDDGDVKGMPVYPFTTPEGIEAFVRSASKPLVLTMKSPEADEILWERPLSMFLITEDEETPSPATVELLEALRTLSRTGLHAVTYVHAAVDSNGEQLFSALMGAHNRKGNVPVVFIVAPGEGDTFVKYLHDGELTLEALKEFEGRYFAGELKPHVKSEVLLEADTWGPVKVVKGKSFKKMVVENENDVLVEFYAPWCPHCKDFEPIYTELATKFEGVKTLVIAKMDPRANDVDHPGVDAKKFPTILLFKSGSKHSPEKYSGTHDLESLEAFISEKVEIKNVQATVVDVHTEL